VRWGVGGGGEGERGNGGVRGVVGKKERNGALILGNEYTGHTYPSNSTLPTPLTSLHTAHRTAARASALAVQC